MENTIKQIFLSIRRPHLCYLQTHCPSFAKTVRGGKGLSLASKKEGRGFLSKTTMVVSSAVVYCLQVHREHFCMWLTLPFIYLYYYCCSLFYLTAVSSKLFLSQPMIFTFRALNSIPSRRGKWEGRGGTSKWHLGGQSWWGLPKPH